MRTIRVIHWNANEASERSAILQAKGYTVDCRMPKGPPLIRELRESQPDAVVIDLSRLPSQGRDIGLMIRKFKSTRFIPLVFVEGDPEKLKGIKRLLPDAVFARWSTIRSSLERAIARPPLQPVVPGSVFDAYQGVPLQKKLGIKPHRLVALVSAPPAFKKQLFPLPSGVVLKSHPVKHCDLIIWFNRSRKEFERKLEAMGTMIGDAKMWIVWPKKGGRLATDLTQQLVRERGLSTGLVDFKICSIDQTWSGLLFTRRKPR